MCAKKIILFECTSVATTRIFGFFDRGIGTPVSLSRRKSLAGLRQKVIRIRAVDGGFIKTPIAWRDEVNQQGVIRIARPDQKLILAT